MSDTKEESRGQKKDQNDGSDPKSDTSVELPLGVFTDSTIKPAPLPEFKPLKEAVRANPNDMNTWETLFSKINQIFVTSLESKREFAQEFKVLVNDSYHELLERFPYLVNHWQKFSIAEYQLNGAQASIEVLQESVNSCQYCLELWDDYLNALSLQKDPRYEAELNTCLLLIGESFNSDKIWDKYLLIVKNSGDDELLCKTYWKLIKIPVYAYAKYYDEYSQLDKLKVLSYVPKEEAIPFLPEDTKDLDECTEVEKVQVIQQLSEAIFANTQTRVSEKWNHESAINYRHLDISQLNNTTEVSHWIKYLDYELANGTHESIINLFEQCLIPNCFQETLWLKYLAYLNFTDALTEKDTRFMIMDAVYSRANNKFLPLNQNGTRFSYGKFLIKFNKIELMHDYHIDLVKYFSGNNYSKLYLKGPYLSSVKGLLENWQLLLPEHFEELILCLINAHTNGDKLKLDEKIFSTIKEEYINLFLKYTNDQAIPIVIQMYLNTYLTNHDLSDKGIAHLRAFFQTHYNKPYLLGFSDFWKFYLELEGLGMYNLGNVNTIMNYIKQNTTLPIITVNNFLKFQYDLFNANLSDFLTQLPNNDCLIKYDSNTRISTQNASLTSRFNKVHLSKQLEYPGVKVDFKPDVTNKLMSEREGFSLLDDKIPSLPSFKNVEKANNPILYPRD